MKLIRKILIGLAILIAIPLIAAVFIKKTVCVERSIIINKPVAEVFNYVKHFKNMSNYGVWFKIDPNMKNTYSGTDGTVGFINSWTSENKQVGTGEQEITNIIENKEIDSELRLKDMGKSEIALITNAEKDSVTHVTWKVSTKIPYPMNIMILFVNMDKMMGSDFEKGLINLKDILEK